MIKQLKMHTPNMIDENIEKIAALFPNVVTEVLKDGKETKAIDFDLLKQELSDVVVEGPQERYQFTWPDKKKSVLLANAPINKTLRPCREESVDFDTTENLYIEGDNLDALKLLQETYLGKVKMIYIDPPYNTGHDFVYEDNFAENVNDYLDESGQFDEEGNRLVANPESNGRFHTAWLNMMYPRLKLAKNLLSDDGAIFIHIDEHEVYTLSLICNEVFGKKNELGTIVWDKRNPKGVVAGVAYQHESILVYCKNNVAFAGGCFSKKKEHADAMIEKVRVLIKKYGEINSKVREEYVDYLKQNKEELTGGERAYSLIDEKGEIYQPVSMAAPDKPETRSHRPLIHPVTGKPCPVPAKGWRFTNQTMDGLLAINKIEFGSDETVQPRQKYYLRDNLYEAVSSLMYYGGSDDAMGLSFDNPKPVYVAKKIISTLCKNDDDIMLDFFSGSSTSAHAVMQLNFEDGGHRKFIMVQLPEETDPKSEACKAGYKNICEIGKERIRRAGKKIKEESPLTTQDLDVGFRVLKIDSSNMKDVYYKPGETQQQSLFDLADNIKDDRSGEDLLFQVMLDLGVDLSAKIKKEMIDGKEVYSVDDGYLIACFEKNVKDSTIKAIAEKKPWYAVFRDNGFASDSTAANCEQIFATYSPDTKRKVL